MLVEINLLPKKEHRKSSQLIIAMSSLLVMAMAISILYIQGSIYESKMDNVDKRILNLQKLNNAQQEKLAVENAGNSVIKLEDAVQWAEQYPVKTVPMMQNIISLLPERGFIQSFEYSGMNSVLLTIQYDAARDAAYYLSSLKQSQWVENADLLNVVAATIDEEAYDSDEKFLPRYSAAYKIVFYPDFFKPDAAEGGDES